MKKIIQMVLVATVFAACQSKSDLNTNKDMIVTDTSAMYRSNIMTDTGSVIQTTMTKNGATPLNAAAVANRPVVINNYYSTPKTSTTTHRSTATRSGNYASSGSGTTTTTRRRGWSHGAKDAVIGGVGGAVVGGIIGKGKGALIGGVLGAGGGYILGRGKDRREGR